MRFMACLTLLINISHVWAEGCSTVTISDERMTGYCALTCAFNCVHSFSKQEIMIGVLNNKSFVAVKSERHESFVYATLVA